MSRSAATRAPAHSRRCGQRLGYDLAVNHDPDCRGWRIVAHQNLEVFAVDLGDGYGGRVLDMDERLLSSPMVLADILKDGSWLSAPAYDFDPALLAEVDVIELDEPGQAHYEEQRRLSASGDASSSLPA